MGSGGRILRGAMAIGVVRLLIILSPLILLPVLIGRWGVEIYGAWITANAVAGFLSAVSVSLLPVLASETALCIGAGNLIGAAKAFRTLALASTFTSLVLSILASIAYYSLATHELYDLAPLEISMVIVLFLGTGLASVASVYAYALAAVGALGLGNATEASRRGVELIFTLIAVLFFDASPLLIALFMLVSAAAALVWGHRLLQARAPWRGQAVGYDWGILKRSSSNMSGSVLLAFAQNQIMVVAPRVLIEMLIGALAVVQFATVSTLARGLRVMTDIFVYPFQPDFSYAWGAQRLERARQLFLVSSRLSLWFAACGTIVLILSAPEFIRVLTGGDLDVERPLVILLSGAVFLESALLPATIWLIATGRVLPYAVVLLVSGTVALAVAVWFALEVGTMVFAGAVLLTSVCAGMAGLHSALPMLELSLRTLVVEALKPPSMAQLRKLLRGKQTS